MLPGHPLSLDEFRFVSALMWEENVMYINGAANGWFQKRNRGHIVPSGNHKVQDFVQDFSNFSTFNSNFWTLHVIVGLTSSGK